MNEFDELFEQKPIKQPQNPVPPGDTEDFMLQVKLQRHNGLMLMIYIATMILFSVGSLLYFNAKYGNTQTILDNIVLVDGPTITNSCTADPEATSCDIGVSATLLNNSGMTLPVMYADFIFIDSDSNEYTFTVQEKDVADGATVTLTDSFTSSFRVTSSSMNVGFDEGGMFYTVIGLLPIAVSGALFLFIDWQAFKYDAKRFRKNFWNHIGTIAFGFGIVWIALIVSQMILTALGVDGTSQNELTIQNMFDANPLHLILLFLLLCVFTPITEEIVFRKVIYNFVEKRSNYVAAIIATGAIFGLMHVISYGDFIQSIPYIFMGLVFGFIYFYSKKNILVTMGVHFINNFITFSIYALMAYGITIV
ncbi:MAG: CPBP family intramembrane metalloprotease [Bacilli bacterium]|nr:CPBP family intramembrane metalloprotease [Bacilli bacterium]MBN2877407.1 CPBP family intramembrane metalloprotease [Bacilli bacterium]